MTLYTKPKVNNIATPPDRATATDNMQYVVDFEHIMVRRVALACRQTYRHAPHNTPLLAVTRSHPEMVSDMSRVTLNFDLSKMPFVYF